MKAPHRTAQHRILMYLLNIFHSTQSRWHVYLNRQFFNAPVPQCSCQEDLLFDRGVVPRVDSNQAQWLMRGSIYCPSTALGQILGNNSFTCMVLWIFSFCVLLDECRWCLVLLWIYVQFLGCILNWFWDITIASTLSES